MPESTYAVNIIISTRDKTSQAAKAASKSLLSLQNAAKLVAVAYAAVRVAQKGIEFVKLGAQAEAAEFRLTRFAGGAAEATEYLEALGRGTDGTVDRMTGMIQASRMLSTHMVQNTDEMEIAGAMVAKLGVQTWTTERRMSSLTMLLANQSIRRLDDFGLSVEAVRKRQKELEEQGLSTEQAFKTAVFDEAQVALATLGDTSELASTKLARIGAAWRNARDGLALYAAEQAKTVIPDEETAAWIESLPGAVREAGEAHKMAASHYTAYRTAMEQGIPLTRAARKAQNDLAMAAIWAGGAWGQYSKYMEESTYLAQASTAATWQATQALNAQAGTIRANWIAEQDYIDALDGAMRSNTELAPAVFTVTTTLRDQANAAMSTSAAMLDLAMSYSAYLQQVSYAGAAYYDSAADIEEQYAKRVAAINKQAAGGGGGGGAAVRFFDEADLKRGLEIMRLQLEEREKTRRDWDKTQAEGEPMFWYELSREDRKYLMESGKTLEDLALEREKSGDDITDLERAQMDDRIADLEREIEERKELLKRGYYESHTIHVAAAGADTQALLDAAEEQRDNALNTLNAGLADQELAHTQSLGRIKLAQFEQWADINLATDGWTDAEVTFYEDMKTEIALKYGLITLASIQSAEDQKAAFDDLWNAEDGAVAMTEKAVGEITKALYSIPKVTMVQVHWEDLLPPEARAELQHGGPAKAGMPYLVGERGPELFVPGSSGHVYNSTQTRNLTNNRTYNFPDARAMAFLSARERAQSRRAFASASGM